MDYINEMLNIWEKTYNERSQKKGKKRAVYSSRAEAKTFLLKEMNKDNLYNRIKSAWQKERIVQEAKFDYIPYELDGVNVIITTEDRVLKDFPLAKHKGIISKASSQFERETLSKVIEQNELKVDPNQYYVIYSDGEM